MRVLKYVAAQDSGQVVSRLTAESQVVGGITQGLSAGLFEERVMDDATGNVVNPNLRDYKIATSLDIPEITPIFVDVVDPLINNLGVKGLGEPARVPSFGGRRQRRLQRDRRPRPRDPDDAHARPRGPQEKGVRVMREFRIAEPRTTDELAALLSETTETGGAHGRAARTSSTSSRAASRRRAWSSTCGRSTGSRASRRRRTGSGSGP